MRGKAGIVIGLAVGYVLGSRAGRKRYDQIAAQWDKVWNLPAVQNQVARAEKFAVSTATTMPGTLWNGAVKIVKAATSQDSIDHGAEAAAGAAKEVAEDVAKTAKDSARAAKRAGQSAERAAKKAQAAAEAAADAAADAKSASVKASADTESAEAPKATD